MSRSTQKMRALVLLLVFALGYLALPTLSAAQTSSSSAKSSLAIPVTGSVAPSATSGPLQ